MSSTSSPRASGAAAASAIPAWRNGHGGNVMAGTMNQRTKIARARKAPAGLMGGLRRIADAGERRRDVLGAIGLLGVAALFAWQAWIIYSKEAIIAQADQVTKWEVHELGEQAATIRQRVQQAMNSATV